VSRVQERSRGDCCCEDTAAVDRIRTRKVAVVVVVVDMTVTKTTKTTTG